MNATKKTNSSRKAWHLYHPLHSVKPKRDKNNLALLSQSLGPSWCAESLMAIYSSALVTDSQQHPLQAHRAYFTMATEFQN